MNKPSGIILPRNQTQIDTIKQYLAYHRLDENDCQHVKRALAFCREYGQKLCEGLTLDYKGVY